jgi:hypothetical protein
MALKGVSTPAVVMMGAGGLFLWSGLKGAKLLTAARSLLQGQQPSATNVNQISGTGFAGQFASGTVPAISGGPPSKGSYNHATLMSLWMLAGGSSATANNAACHAMQESSGDPKVTSSNPDGGTNVGLWQLDTKGKGAGYPVVALQNALLNARITVLATHNGLDWSAWSTPGC